MNLMGSVVLGAVLLGLAACGKKEEPAVPFDPAPMRAAVIRLQDAPGVPAQPLYKESHALVVGVSDYSASPGWKSLPGVRRDVAAVAAALQAQGFQIHGDPKQEGLPLLDPNYDTLNAVIRRFFANYGGMRDARLMVYFAGHGLTLPGAETDKEIGFIVPADAPHPQQDEGGFRQRAVNMAEFDRIAKETPAKHIMFVFDSCFSGALFSMRSGGDIIPAKISQATREPVREFLTSGSANQLVPDESDFRKAFVQALQAAPGVDADGDGFVTGAELSRYVTAAVRKAQGSAQTPQYGKGPTPGLSRGDFVFTTALNQPAQARPERAQQSQGWWQRIFGTDDAQAEADRQAWELARQVNTPAGYASYLNEFPKGRFAGAARVALATPQASVEAPPAPATAEPVLAAEPIDRCKVANPADLPLSCLKP